MRLLEIVLVVGELLTLFVLAIPRLHSARWIRYSAYTCVVLAAGQALIEGPRWQLVPAYVLSVAFLFASRLRRRKFNPAIVVIVGGLAVAFVAALPAMLPIFHFPRPSGPYGVGTVTYYWVDKSRPEIFTATPGAHRELMVQFWYPAKQHQESQRAPYIAPGTNLAATARLVHLPPFFFDHLTYVTTNAQPAAPMAVGPARFPVLIFAPGRGGYRQNNTFEVEELVSHGYIVAGIDQPYTVGDVIFPDGRHVELDKRVSDSVLDEQIGKNSFMLRVYDNLGADAVFALNQLAVLNKADPNRILTGRLNLQRVGIFGTSLGGITVAQACRSNHRFRACLILDVAMPPNVVRSGLQQPTMWISATDDAKRHEGWTPSEIREQRTTIRAVFSILRTDGYMVSIPGMFHADISDAPNFITRPLGALLGFTGPTDWHRSHAIINNYSTAFFDTYLKSRPEPLLKGPSPEFPDVIFERRK